MNSKTALTCASSTPPNHSMKSWTVAPSARLPKRADTGSRVSLNTQAPLTLPGTLSTAEHFPQSRHAVTSLSIADSSAS